jgi:hypothetical protein
MSCKRSFAALAWSSLFVSGALSQTVLHVDDDATPPGNGSVAQPFPDIATAIAAAVSGDTILVEDGWYQGFDFAGKNVAVRSVNGKLNASVFGALPSGNTIEVAAGEGPGAELDGFTVFAGFNYALWVSGSAPTVRNCDFVGAGTHSAGVQVSTPAAGPGVLFEDVLVAYHDFQQPYGAWVGLEVTGPGLYRRCVVGDNWATFGVFPGPNVLGGVGAGLRANPAGFGPGAIAPVFEDCDVVGNSGGAAVGDPGGFGGAVGDAIYRRCRILNNVGGYGAYLDDPPFCGPGLGGNAGAAGYRSMTDCVVAGNVGGAADTSPGGGGALGSGPMLHCTVVHNGDPQFLAGTWRNCIVRDNGPPGSQTTLSPFGGSSASYCNVKGAVPGVGNFDLPEFFVNATARDYRLTQFSPSIDAGDPSAAGLSTTDLDGEPRVFGGRVDIGADEHTGALVNLPPAAGNVGDATGANGPFDVLKINGTAGYSGRTVDVALGAPLTFELAAPPGVAGPFSYVLCGMFGVPNANYYFPSPFGTFLFLPAPVDPLAPGFFTLASDVAFPSAPALVPTSPAPITVAVPGGLPFPLTIALQAAVVAGGPAPTDIRVSNGVVLRAY